MDGDSERARNDLSRAQARVLLQSWKEIANHLGVCLRTAQLWRERCGLPVYHEGVGRKRRVVAYSDDLERWREARRRAGEACSEEDGAGGKPETLIPEQDHVPEGTVSDGGPETRHTRRARLFGWGSAALWGLAGVVAGGFLLWRWVGGPGRNPQPPGPPDRAVVERTWLKVLDAEGRLCWKKEFPRLHRQVYQALQEGPWLNWHLRDFLAVQDIDSDGRPEVVFSYWHSIEDHKTEPSPLICYEANGTERWRFVPGREKHWGKRELNDLYEVRFFRALRAGGLTLLLVCAHNKPRFACQVTLLDPSDGTIVSEYWHPGHLHSCLIYDFDRDGGPEILLGGVNNPGEGWGHAALVLLDVPFAKAKPEAAGADRGLAGWTGGGELKYILFPRSDLCEPAQVSPGAEYIGLDGPDVIRVGVGSQNLPPINRILSFHCEYHFDLDLVLRHCIVHETYVTSHARARRQGLVDHDLDEAERAWLSRIQPFRTAPDGNSAQVAALFGRPDRSGPRAESATGRRAP